MGEQARCKRCGLYFEAGFFDFFPNLCEKCKDEQSHQEKMQRLAEENNRITEANQRCVEDNEHSKQSNADIENNFDEIESIEDKLAKMPVAEENKLMLLEKIEKGEFTMEGLQIEYPGKSLESNILNVDYDEFEDESEIHIPWWPIISRMKNELSGNNVWPEDFEDQLEDVPRISATIKLNLNKDKNQNTPFANLYVICMPNKNLRSGKIIVNTGTENVPLYPFDGEQGLVKELEQDDDGEDNLFRIYYETVFFAIDKNIISKIASAESIKYKISCLNDAFVETDKNLHHLFRVAYNQLFDNTKYMESLNYVEADIKNKKKEKKQENYE